MDTTAPLLAYSPLPSSPKLSEILAADLGNFGVGYSWRAEALAWRKWWADQKAAWDKP